MCVCTSCRLTPSWPMEQLANRYVPCVLPFLECTYLQCWDAFLDGFWYLPQMLLATE